MQARGLLIATAALALLAAGVWFSNKEEAKKAAAPKADAAPRVLSIPLVELREVIVDRGKDHVRVERHEDTTYGVLEPVKVAADTEAATALFLALSALDAEHMVDEKPASVAQFGLDPARVTITAVRKKGPPVKVLLGETSPTGTSTYAKVEGDPRVFTFAQGVAASFEKTFADLRDKRLMPIDRTSLSQVLVTSKGTAELKPEKSGWTVGGHRADGSMVEQLLTAIDQAKMNPQTPEAVMADAVKAWSAAAPVGAVRITDAAGAHSIEVRRAKTKDKDAVFVKSTAIEGVHMGSPELADALAKPAAEYRNARLFDFGFDDPTKVEIKGANLNRTLTQADSKWSEGGTALDSVGAQSLVDKLRELRASGFVTNASGAIDLELTVVSNNGQRTEHVTIFRDGSKGGNSFTARREGQGEPEYYSLDAADVSNLRQAAADVKNAVKASSAANKDGK